MTTFSEIKKYQLYSPISEEVIEEGRWNKSKVSIIEHEGKFYAVKWYEGLTEYQEDEYPEDDEEIPEVFKFEKFHAIKETVYLEENKAPVVEVISKSAMKNFKLLGLDTTVKSELDTLKNYSTAGAEILEALNNVEVLMQDETFKANAEVVKRFIEKLVV